MADGVDRARISAAVRELLGAIGADADSAELSATPERVADAYTEFFAGMWEDPLTHLTDAVPAGERVGELVLMRDIDLRSICEHHLLPFRGTAHIAYQPGARVVGLSALPRVVETLAARPQVQERLGEQIAQTLEDGLDPEGVLVDPRRAARLRRRPRRARNPSPRRDGRGTRIPRRRRPPGGCIRVDRRPR